MSGLPRPEAIAREIRNDILHGRRRPGERLPSERELAAQTGVHRSSAREALRILAQQRLIEVQPGGARVIPVHRANLDVLAHLIDAPGGPDAELMAQLLDVHELLLVGAARLAVERGSDEELARAHALLTNLARGDVTHAEFLETMRALVEGIAEASRNLVLRMVGNGLLGVVTSAVAALQRGRPPGAELARVAVAARRALESRDAEGAERAIRALLRTRREQVLKELAQNGTAAPPPVRKARRPKRARGGGPAAR